MKNTGDRRLGIWTCTLVFANYLIKFFVHKLLALECEKYFYETFLLQGKIYLVKRFLNLQNWVNLGIQLNNNIWQQGYCFEAVFTAGLQSYACKHFYSNWLKIPRKTLVPVNKENYLESLNGQVTYFNWRFELSH